MLDMLEEKTASEQRFIEEKYKILRAVQATPASPSSSLIAASYIQGASFVQRGP